MGFALFFLAEYCSMILMSTFTVIMFMGGWQLLPFPFFLVDPFVFGVKIALLMFFYIWTRASFPRYRIDQLMRLCWKIFLPLAFAFVIFYIGVLYSFNGFY
jgi:NADH-quinone oxidoreductase subunit H